MSPVVRPADHPADATLELTWRAPLVAAARAAAARAYAPYSRFAVGAALLDEHGHIHAGCNVENAAYPQGQCAEAGAIAAMVLAGGRRIVAAAVVGSAAPAGPACTPCGGCRQRLREFAADATPVWLDDGIQPRGATTLGALLPQSFGPAHLQAPATTPSEEDAAP